MFVELFIKLSKVRNILDLAHQASAKCASSTGMDHAHPEAKYTSDNLPAAFWDEYPENAENHADYAAINAILEESTPDERAETYKAISY